jgi:hypothetical protein
VVGGRRDEKFARLEEIHLDDGGWRLARSGWVDPFTPTPDGDWDAFPALDDLMPWTSPGVTGNRRWPFAPSREVLRRRWETLGGASEAERAQLFKVTRDRSLARPAPAALPGIPDAPTAPVGAASGPLVRPVRIGWRAFDRQWGIPDARLLDMPRPDLWRARIPDQVWVVEQHAHPLRDGPGLVFSSLIPDLHHFNNRGGRTAPFLHPNGSTNFARGLTEALASALGCEVTGSDVLAYVAGVVAHPAYTARFSDQLTTPGIRVPVTADAALWREAVNLGQWVLWCHTYGERFWDEDAGRRRGTVRMAQGDERRPLCVEGVPLAPEGMPVELRHDPETQTLHVGDGRFAPVTAEAFAYSVGGRNVVRSWFNYRKKDPSGRVTSPLDTIHAEAWPGEWTRELLDLLALLTRLVELAPPQADVLARILDRRLLTRTDLAAAGVVWPASKTDRMPRGGAPGGGALSLDLEV